MKKIWLIQVSLNFLYKKNVMHLYMNTLVPIHTHLYYHMKLRFLQLVI